MTRADETTDTERTSAADRALFRRTLVRVMAVQILALIALWLLQQRYWR